MTPIERGDELNELGWWSHWAELGWFSKSCYHLHSREFTEPLFNHAGFLSTRVSLDLLLGRVERRYGEGGTIPAFFLQDTHEYASIRERILSRGYRVADQFLVMKLVRAPSNPTAGMTIKIVRGEDLDDWCKAYLSAFYGEHSLLKSVRASVKKALKEGRTKLVLAEVGDRPAGTLAIYRRDHYSGVYCVGTVPQFRGRGVATSMLRRARDIAESDGTTMLLQTFLSDSFENFYRDRGFKRIYSKSVLLKN